MDPSVYNTYKVDLTGFKWITGLDFQHPVLFWIQFQVEEIPGFVLIKGVTGYCRTFYLPALFFINKTVRR